MLRFRGPLAVQLRFDPAQPILRISCVPLSQVTPVWSAMTDGDSVAENRLPIRREIVLALRSTPATAFPIALLELRSGDEYRNAG